jgi:hypothetical protein
MLQDALAFSLPGKLIIYADFRSLIHPLDDGGIAPPRDGGNMLQDAALFSLPGIQLSYLSFVLAKSYSDESELMLQDASAFSLPGKLIFILTSAR